MKMSKKLMLATVMTGAVFALSGCIEEKEPKYEDMSFSTPEACVGGKPSDVELASEWESICNTSYKNAVAAHEKEAPHYVGADGKALCEAQHGVGKCYSPAEIAKEGDTADPAPNETAGVAAATTASSGGNWFMPFMAGWMVSSLFDSVTGNRSYQSSNARPLYASASGGYYNSNGYRFNSLNSKKDSNVSNTSYYKSKPTTYTRSTVRSTGGFGASRTSSYSSSRSYGG